jgi:hypothetical protein
MTIGKFLRSRQKINPYFLTVQTAKKDRQSLSFFGGKSKRTPGPDWFCVVFTEFEGRQSLPSNPNQPGKK